MFVLDKTRAVSKRSKPRNIDKKESIPSNSQVNKKKDTNMIDMPNGKSETPNSAPFNRDIELKWKNKAGMHSPCDLIVKTVFHCYEVHKFPFCSRSKYFSRATKTTSNGQLVINLEDLPGGSEAFEFIGNFCYGVEYQFTSSNVASVLSAAYFLEMVDDSSGLYSDPNLISIGESFLTNFLSNCSGALNIVFSYQELGDEDDHHILSRAIHALSNFAASKSNQELRVHLSEKVIKLDIKLFQLVVEGFKKTGLSPADISDCVQAYAIKWLPFPKKGGQNSTSPNIKRQLFKSIIDTIVRYLSSESSVTSLDFLFHFLQTANSVLSNKDSVDEIYSIIAYRFYAEASSKDLLNLSVDDVQAIFEKFMHDSIQRRLLDPTKSRHAAANLLDTYLIDMCSSSDVHKRVDYRIFIHLANLIPFESRGDLDGIYRSIKAFAQVKRVTGLSAGEFLELCKLLDPTKLTHSVQQEICTEKFFPLPFVVKILESQKKDLEREIQFLDSKCEKIEKNNANGDYGKMQEKILNLQKQLESENENKDKLRAQADELERLSENLSKMKFEKADLERRLYELKKAKKGKSVFRRMFLDP